MSKKVESFPRELWKDAPLRKPTRKTRYEISNYGRIKSVERATENEKVIKGSTSVRGFKLLNVRLEDGSRQSLHIHKAVAQLFVKRPSEDTNIVIHLDFIKDNNRYENLKWVTKDQWKKHLVVNPNFIAARMKQKDGNKLNASQVKMIKRMIERGKTKKRIIAKQFGVTVTHINRIISGENWSHVTLDD